MAKWVKYTGSDEQLEEIQKSKHGVMTEDFIVIDGSAPIHDLLCIGDEYLICQQHPYADEIDIWRMSCCPVWYRFKGAVFDPGIETEKPDWSNDELEFRLTPFGD